MARLSRGERIAASSAILLFVFMFFNWFGNKDSGEVKLFSVGHRAWDALDCIPIVLLGAIVTTVALAVLRLAGAGRKSYRQGSMVVAGLGLLSVLLILFRIVDPPILGSFREIWGMVDIEATVQFPIFLALMAAIGMTVGASLAVRDEAVAEGDGR
jgi:hypothetical protein